MTVVDQPTELLERDDVLRAITEAVSVTRAGRGSVIIVEGAAGEGKSVLLAAATRDAGADDVLALMARGGELEREYPFGVMRQLLLPVIASASSAERARLLAGAAAPARQLLGYRSDHLQLGPASGGSGDTIETLGALHALHLLVTRVAMQAPVVLAVDDGHWADASSLRALDFIARRAAELPISVIVAVRTAEPGAAHELLDELAFAPGTVRLLLRPLSAAASARAVRALVPDADDAACDAVFEVTAGNPFYLHELLRAVDLAVLTAGVDPAATLRQAAIAPLGERVLRRVQRVSERAPTLAQAMAVLGDGGRLSDAATLADLGISEAGRIAYALRRLEVLAAEDPFAFVHPLVRRSVYDAIPAPERDAIHRAAAAGLRDRSAPIEAVAAHYGAVIPSGCPEVASTLVDAATSALSRASPDESARWLRRALAEQAAAPPRDVILRQLGQTEASLRDPAAITHLRQALDCTAEAERAGPTALALVEILLMDGQWQEGLALMDEMEARLGDPERADGDRGDDGQLRAELAALKAATTLYDPALVALFDRQRDRFRTLSHGPGWAARGLAAVLGAAAAQRGDDVARAREDAVRALADGYLFEERNAGGWAPAQAMLALISIDDCERTRSVADDAAVAAQASGSLGGLMISHCFRCFALAVGGDLGAAETEARVTFDLLRAMPVQMYIVSALHCAAEALVERPSMSDLVERTETVELEPRFDGTWTGAMLRWIRGRLRLVRRDQDRGIADVRAAGAICDALGFGPHVMPWRSTLALALPPSGRAEAQALVAEELELSMRVGLPRSVGIARRASGLLARGEPGIAQLRESVSLLAGSPARLEHARSLLALGSALRRCHRRADACGPLTDAAVLARACGATRLAARADDELRAAGGRPPRQAIVSGDALTASERRIATLAADGATNAQIAADLFVSLKTVETHLSHAYAKLGLAGPGSRRRIRAALNDRQQLSTP